jgi:DNA-binding response OmpR family regulator
VLLENSANPAHDAAMALTSVVTLLERVTTLQEANFVIHNYEYDIVLVDIAGRYALPRLLRSKRRIPVIMLADKSQRLTAIRYLGPDADHYVIRPLVATELLACMRTVRQVSINFPCV